MATKIRTLDPDDDKLVEQCKDQVVDIQDLIYVQVWMLNII
jgi:hypothetical protein